MGNKLLEYLKTHNLAQEAAKAGVNLLMHPERRADTDYAMYLPVARGSEGASLAVPGAVHDVLTSAKNMLLAPRDAIAGRLSDADMQARASDTTNTLLNLSGLNVAPKGSLGVFAGRRAKTANDDALMDAKQMFANGERENKIFKQTGWYKDKDYRWKFEIPDSEAKLKSYVPLQNQTLTSILDHPKLFEAYPELANLPVQWEANAGRKGGYSPAMDTLSLNNSLQGDDLLSTILHEIQHGIQHREGFGRGGSMKDFLDPEWYERNAAATGGHQDLVQSFYEDQVQSKVDPRYVLQMHDLVRRNALPSTSLALSENELGELMKFADKHPEHFAKLSDSYQTLYNNHQERLDAYDKYLNLTGEVEARNVQDRLRNPAAYAEHPHRSPNYPQGEQILNYAEEPGYGRAVDQPSALSDPESFKGFHGTPHTFDEFSNDAIGTGEGAQVYGYGHYVAGREGVAEHYRKTLSGTQFRLGDQPLPMDAHHTGYLRPLYDDNEGKIEDILKETSRNIADHKAMLSTAELTPSGRQGIEKDLAAWQKAHDVFSHPEFNVKDNPGHLLHLEVTPDEHELLDWDTPLSGMHPDIQAKLRPHVEESLRKQWDAIEEMRQRGKNFTPRNAVTDILMNSMPEDIPGIASGLSGEDIYKRLGFPAADAAEGQKNASAKLSALGIPGIRYLDAVSRNITDPATYAGELTPQQARGLKMINSAGQGSRWEGGDPTHYLDRLIENYTTTLENGTPAQYMVGGRSGVQESLEALKSLDRAKLVGPSRTRNYVIFDPKHIKIVGRNGVSSHD